MTHNHRRETGQLENRLKISCTSGAIKAIVPSNCPWNSPAPVVCEANLAAAPKSPILNLWPVLSTSKLAPKKRKYMLVLGFK